jgi:hypothetical protein
LSSRCTAADAGQPQRAFADSGFLAERVGEQRLAPRPRRGGTVAGQRQRFGVLDLRVEILRQHSARTFASVSRESAKRCMLLIAAGQTGAGLPGRPACPARRCSRLLDRAGQVGRRRRRLGLRADTSALRIERARLADLAIHQQCRGQRQRDGHQQRGRDARRSALQVPQPASGSAARFASYSSCDSTPAARAAARASRCLRTGARGFVVLVPACAAAASTIGRQGQRC